MHRGRDCGETPRTFNRHVTFRVYLLHQEVRSMSKAFRMYLLHPDDDLSCSGSARASAQHGRSGQDVSFASGRGHGSPLGMPPFALIPRGAGDEMWSDGLWKGWSGGIGYAARDMARQVKWEDPAMRRERERERTRASGRRACEKEARE